MKRILSIAALSVALAAGSVSAIAAPWTPINQRQASLYARIEQGVHSGALTRNEADSLKSQFMRIAGLEAQYRHSAGGLTEPEKADLERRLSALSARIYVNKHDAQHR